MCVCARTSAVWVIQPSNRSRPTNQPTNCPGSIPNIKWTIFFVFCCCCCYSSIPVYHLFAARTSQNINVNANAHTLQSQHNARAQEKNEERRKIYVSPKLNCIFTMRSTWFSVVAELNSSISIRYGMMKIGLQRKKNKEKERFNKVGISHARISHNRSE